MRFGTSMRANLSAPELAWTQTVIRNDADFIVEKVNVRQISLSNMTKSTAALSVVAVASVLVIKRTH